MQNYCKLNPLIICFINSILASLFFYTHKVQTTKISILDRHNFMLSLLKQFEQSILLFKLSNCRTNLPNVLKLFW